jgi:Protein of unknown function (DUF2752)
MAENPETVKASTVERVLALICAAGMSAATFAAGYFNPATAGFFPVCPLLKLTGFACPGCGMTRGFHALLHGDMLTALDYNLLLPAVLFFFGYLFVSFFLTFARGRGLSFKAFTPFVIWSFFGVALAFMVLRNLPFYPFNILYP